MIIMERRGDFGSGRGSEMAPTVGTRAKDERERRGTDEPGA